MHFGRLHTIDFVLDQQLNNVDTHLDCLYYLLLLVVIPQQTEAAQEQEGFSR